MLCSIRIEVAGGVATVTIEGAGRPTRGHVCESVADAAIFAALSACALAKSCGVLDRVLDTIADPTPPTRGKPS